MKKVCALFLSFFTMPAMASGIDATSASAPCTNNTLETYSGNTNLQADWQPNEIQLRWYNNNTLLNVQSSANTCVYDSTLTIPTTAPTRTGYTFAGWTVRPEYDLDQLDDSIDGTDQFSKSVINNRDYCRFATVGVPATEQSCNNQNYANLYRHEWKTVFSYGTIYGTAKCVPSGTAKANIDTATTGDYCYCKITGYKPNNSDILYGPKKKMKWVAYASAGNTTYCLQQCAMYCAYVIQSNSIGSGHGNCPNCRKNLLGK